MSLSSPTLDQLPDLPTLYRAAQAFTASLDLTEVAAAAARIPAAALGARSAVVRLLDLPTEALRVEARFEEGGESVAAAIDEAVAGLTLREGKPLLLTDLAADARLAPLGAAPGTAGLAAPLVYQGRPLGALCLFRGGPPNPAPPFTEADLRLLAALASHAAVGLANAQQFHTAKHRAAELEALREISQAVVGRLELPAVLEAVVAGGMRLLQSEHAQIVLWDEGTHSLRYGAALGPEAERVRQQTFTLGRGVNGMVALTRKPMIVDDYARSPHALAEFTDVQATITIPVLFGDRLLGVLHSHTTDPVRRFTQDDLRLMTLLATQAAIAIENARLFEEAEQLAEAHLLRLKQIAILNEIGNAMQGTMHLDALLQVILTGVTFGGGLGFNRAILLLLDETTGVLRARLGVGPASGEEAAQVWHTLTSPTRRLSEVIAERAGQQRPGDQSAFDQMVRKLEIPLDQEDSMLAQAVREGRPFRVVRGSQPPPGQSECVLLDVDEFAAVPLLAKGKMLGALMVDNKYNGKPITDADLELLAVFANQAGLAVEHARVYTRLEDAHREIQRSHHQLVRQERLAALGEMAAHVVHEIRNPLVAIGGFARRLARRLEGREPEGVYAQVIGREVDRLERIVQDVRGMSREMHMHLIETDLHELIQECLVLVAERIALQGVALRMELCPQTPRLLLDPVRVKQAILNLLGNALEAMPEGGTLQLATQVVGKNGAEGEAGGASGETVRDASPGRRRREPGTYRLAPGEWVILSVRDTGGGIPPEIEEQVFQPFFTTKEVGTGLGLTLVRRIAGVHGGRVEMENRPGQGVTFRLWLPAPESTGPAGAIPPQGGAP